jgi:NADPH:quinone reductase-like Zn-dependent oxidoreductase
MTLRSKVLSGALIFLVLAGAALAFVLSHNSPCGPAPALVGQAPRMKAIVYRCYGPPEVLKYEDVVKPVPDDNQLLVKVRAASINPYEWHFMRGSPYFMRLGVGLGAPTDSRLGVDFSGTVEAVGKSVTRFKVGDEVFGGDDGALAEYVVVRELGTVALKPPNITFEQAASVPIAAVTALQGLRDTGQIKAGQKVLINGASGGVGTFAVQIAKSYGAEVTGVCSTRNVALVKSLGADHVIDYTREDFTRENQHYDMILDTVGNHPLLDYRRVMQPSGILLMVGGPKGDWLGPLAGPVKAKVLGPFVSQKFELVLASLNRAALETLRDLMQTGKVTPVVDRTYPLHEVQAAMQYLEAGHARGKVVITVP